jgi:hypothetical protein
MRAWRGVNEASRRTGCSTPSKHPRHRKAGLGYAPRMKVLGTRRTRVSCSLTAVRGVSDQCVVQGLFRSAHKRKIFFAFRFCLYASKRTGVFFFWHLGLVNIKFFCDGILPI